jgi:outer membrane protein assembly factor BamB
MTCGYPKKFIFAIQPDGQGNVTKTHVLWQTSRDCSYVPSPLVIGPYFLIVSDKGVASCYQAKIGRRLWRENLGDRHSASLVSADGLVYFLSDHGLMTVLRPGPELDVVSRNKLSEETYASPAISHGQIFLRGEKHLFCIGTGLL